MPWGSRVTGTVRTAQAVRAGAITTAGRSRGRGTRGAGIARRARDRYPCRTRNVQPQRRRIASGGGCSPARRADTRPERSKRVRGADLLGDQGADIPESMIAPEYVLDCIEHVAGVGAYNVPTSESFLPVDVLGNGDDNHLVEHSLSAT